MILFLLQTACHMDGVQSDSAARALDYIVVSDSAARALD